MITKLFEYALLILRSMDGKHQSEKKKIFQKRPAKSVDISFKISTEIIEIVQEYTYLGIRQLETLPLQPNT